MASEQMAGTTTSATNATQLQDWPRTGINIPNTKGDDSTGDHAITLRQNIRPREAGRPSRRTTATLVPHNTNPPRKISAASNAGRQT